MANKNYQNSNQSGKVAGLAVGVAAASGVSAFGAGFGGAALYDQYTEPVEEPQELTIEENVEVFYDEEPESQHSVILEPETPAVPAQPAVGIDINTVPVIISTDDMPDVNPDDVTDDILAEEMVDPTDLDVVTIVEFTDLNTRYDADGNELTVAYFHDHSTDSDMMLVDNNGDGTFDYVVDANGNYCGDTVLGTTFTVDDVEAQLSDSTYLAANGTPDAVLDNGDSYLNDIVTV